MDQSTRTICDHRGMLSKTQSVVCREQITSKTNIPDLKYFEMIPSQHLLAKQASKYLLLLHSNKGIACCIGLFSVSDSKEHSMKPWDLQGRCLCGHRRFRGTLRPLYVWIPRGFHVRTSCQETTALMLAALEAWQSVGLWKSYEKILKYYYVLWNRISSSSGLLPYLLIIDFQPAVVYEFVLWMRSTELWLLGPSRCAEGLTAKSKFADMDRILIEILCFRSCYVPARWAPSSKQNLTALQILQLQVCFIGEYRWWIRPQPLCQECTWGWNLIEVKVFREQRVCMNLLRPGLLGNHAAGGCPGQRFQSNHRHGRLRMLTLKDQLVMFIWRQHGISRSRQSGEWGAAGICALFWKDSCWYCLRNQPNAYNSKYGFGMTQLCLEEPKEFDAPNSHAPHLLSNPGSVSQDIAVPGALTYNIVICSIIF